MKDAPAKSELPTFTWQEEVMFYDTDIGGVVHNLAYLRMIEACRTKLATGPMEMNLKAMKEEGVVPVVLHTEVKYHAAATLGDVLTIHGRIEKMERVRFWCSFELTTPRVERVLVTCRQSLGLVNPESGKPRRLPAEWRERWG